MSPLPLGIEVVPSQYFDLGPIDPAWCSRDRYRNMLANAIFETRYDKGGTHIVDSVSNLSTIAFMGFADPPKNTENPELVDKLGRTVTEIDLMYRAHRGISTDVILEHAVTYRKGRARGATVLHHTHLTLNLLPFHGPGIAHFDGTDEGGEIITLNHGGRSTTLFLGPVLKIRWDSTFSGTLSRLLDPPSIKAPKDRAVLTDQDTLHGTSAQAYLPFWPTAFFRSFISAKKPGLPGVSHAVAPTT